MDFNSEELQRYEHAMAVLKAEREKVEAEIQETMSSKIDDINASVQEAMASIESNLNILSSHGLP